MRALLARGRWTLGAAALAALALVAAACGGGGGESAAAPVEPTYRALPVSGPPVVGESRIALALLDADNLFVDAERVQVRFFRISDGSGRLAGEAEATERRFENFLPHLHPEGIVHPHSATTVFYAVDRFNFDAAGEWGLQVVATLPDGQAVTVLMDSFQVTDKPSWPVVGRPAPATHNKTLREVADIAEIDTSSPPRPFMHQVAIDEALAQRRPFVVTFSTPAFCRTAVCGPVTDVVASFYEKYKDRLAFIHVEPYNLEALRKQQRYELLPIVQQWGIPSEPWTFVVRADGRVVADFGGLFAPEELEAAIQEALASAAGGY